MGKIAEMVEAEATKAEAESPDDEEGDEDEDEDEGESEPESEPDTEQSASMEAALKAFEKENQRHEKALAKLMGDDFGSFELCAGCNGVGFRPVAAVPYAAGYEQCATCKGHGSLLTGSLAPGKEIIECAACQGQGFTIHVDVPEAPAYAPPPVPRFDSYTGELLPAGAEPYNGGQGGPWAPGYVPGATSAPSATIGG